MKDFCLKHRAEIAIWIVGFVAVNFVIAVNYFIRQFTTLDAEYGEHFGAFVGGYFGSLFSLAAIILLLATLKAQQLAYTEQNIASAQQHFETKYFELIKMHRDNVLEIGMKGGSGRKVFVLLLRELRCTLEIIKEVAQRSKQQLTKQQLLHIAYYCLFYGVGPNSSRMLKISLSEFDWAFVDKVEKELNLEETKERVRRVRNFPYKPFEGHQSRLGHYYRHLYQMVTYIDQQKLVALDPDTKYEYVKTIRAQLSTHEQALLLLNSLTPIGHNWWEKNLITTYRLVKNIPRDFFDPIAELDVATLFKSDYFEWEEKA